MPPSIHRDGGRSGWNALPDRATLAPNGARVTVMPGPRLLLGVLLVPALLAVLDACGVPAAVSTTPMARVSPSPDPLVVHYRHLIDADMSAINFALYRSRCNSRETCTSTLMQVETATEALLSDLSNAVAPSGVGPTVEPFKLAAQQFEEQVDGDLIAIQQPNSDFIAATPTVADLFLAAATFDCWPSKPVNFGGEGGYNCSETGATSIAPLWSAAERG